MSSTTTGTTTIIIVIIITIDGRDDRWNYIVADRWTLVARVNTMMMMIAVRVLQEKPSDAITHFFINSMSARGKKIKKNLFSMPIIINGGCRVISMKLQFYR